MVDIDCIVVVFYKFLRKYVIILFKLEKFVVLIEFLKIVEFILKVEIIEIKGNFESIIKSIESDLKDEL